MYNYVWKNYTRIIRIQRVAIVMTVFIDKPPIDLHWFFEIFIRTEKKFQLVYN